MSATMRATAPLLAHFTCAWGNTDANRPACFTHLRCRRMSLYLEGASKARRLEGIRQFLERQAR